MKATNISPIQGRIFRQSETRFEVHGSDGISLAEVRGARIRFQPVIGGNINDRNHSDERAQVRAIIINEVFGI